MDLTIDTEKVEIRVKPFTHEEKMFFQVTNHSVNLKSFATLNRVQAEKLRDYLTKQLEAK